MVEPRGERFHGEEVPLEEIKEEEEMPIVEEIKEEVPEEEKVTDGGIEEPILEQEIVPEESKDIL